MTIDYPAEYYKLLEEHRKEWLPTEGNILAIYMYVDNMRFIAQLSKKEWLEFRQLYNKVMDGKFTGIARHYISDLWLQHTTHYFNAVDDRKFWNDHDKPFLTDTIVETDGHIGGNIVVLHITRDCSPVI